MNDKLLGLLIDAKKKVITCDRYKKIFLEGHVNINFIAKLFSEFSSMESI